MQGTIFLQDAELYLWEAKAEFHMSALALSSPCSLSGWPVQADSRGNTVSNLATLFMYSVLVVHFLFVSL